MPGTLAYSWRHPRASVPQGDRCGGPGARRKRLWYWVYPDDILVFLSNAHQAECAWSDRALSEVRESAVSTGEHC